MPDIDLSNVKARLRRHVEVLTREIGDRSVARPEHLNRAARYIESAYAEMGLAVQREPYPYGGMTVMNLIAEKTLGTSPRPRYVLGAHYDTVSGTAGADDNASAVAVQLETARCLAARKRQIPGLATVRFVSFTLEEPPAFNTRHQGSRVHVKNLKKANIPVDGMLCLEMVGFTCRKPGCQDYPFPLMFFGYPDTGDFVGIVGDFQSRRFTRAVAGAFRRNPDLPLVHLTVPSKGWLPPPVRLSDHASFWDAGIPAVMITDTAFYRNPHYHLSSDTMDTLDFEFMAQLVKSLVIFFVA